MREDEFYRQNIVSSEDRRRSGCCGCCPTLIAGPTGPIGPIGPGTGGYHPPQPQPQFEFSQFQQFAMMLPQFRVFSTRIILCGSRQNVNGESLLRFPV